MHHYYYYGMNISSDLKLPELKQPLAPFLTDTIDVHFHRDHVPKTGLLGSQILSPFIQASVQQLWLNVPSIARFLIKNGNEIIYEPTANIDEDSLRVFLLGSCTGALLYQRNFLVLHGNAFEVDGGSVICVGNSGAGKSTLAAAMMLRGHRIIADDVCPIDDKDNVVPGMPRIKLWQDSADKLNIDTKNLTRIRPALNKFNYPLGKDFCDSSLPVKAIYILHQHNELGFKLQTITGMDKYRPLKNNTYRLQYVKGMSLERQHFKQCGKLADKVHLCHIFRPKNNFQINELANFLFDDLTRQGLC